MMYMYITYYTKTHAHNYTYITHKHTKHYTQVHTNTQTTQLLVMLLYSVLLLWVVNFGNYNTSVLVRLKISTFFLIYAISSENEAFTHPKNTIQRIKWLISQQ